MIVMKFGGSSLADAGCLRQVGRLVRQALPEAPLVVLSASGDTTDALVEAARAAEGGHLEAALAALRGVLEHHRGLARDLFGGAEPASRRPFAAALATVAAELELRLRGVALLRELTPRTLDSIAATGELLSSRLFADWFGAELADARTFLRTDASFGRARPDREALRQLVSRELAPRLRPGRPVVTQGYVGATADGLTTTLGRGGSDYSASLLGAALGAVEVQIWTDVEGVLTGDPRLVPEAVSLPELSFAEAAELAAFGARVLHPATLQPAVDARIPVTVRHTHKPAGAFTTISEAGLPEASPLAVAGRGPIVVLTVTSPRMLHQAGFLARLFEVFGRHGVSVDLVATAEVSVSVTVEESAPVEALVTELAAFAKVEVVRGRALVAVVGRHLRRTPGLAGRLFGALSPIAVEMISMGANDINLSLIVRLEEMAEAMRRLHGVLPLAAVPAESAP